jgi:hypothetical protein
MGLNTFPQQFKIAAAIQAATEPDGDKFIRYTDGLTDAALAARLTKEFGFSVTEFNVISIRKGVAGVLRRGPGFKPGNKHATASVRAEVAELRAAVHALGEMVENLQKVVMRRHPVYIGNGARVSA